MNKKFTKLMAALALLAFLAIPMGMWGQTTTLVSGSGSSGYTVPDGWTTSGTVEGGQYLKFDNGTMTSPEFAPHNGLSFTYSVATFGSGTNHPLTIRVLNASTNAVIVEKTTATPTSSSYISTDSPLSLGDVAVAFKIQMYGPSGKGVRLRNYSVTGTPAGDIPATYTVTYDCNGGTSGCPQNETGIELNEEITLADAPSKTGHAFDGWNDGALTYDAGDSYTVSENVTMTAQWTAYTITAQSNNDSYGTVSLSGTTITATPNSGYRVIAGNGGYTVTAGTATVTNNGDNTFSVTPESDCTVTINFEAIPTHAATFSVNGTTNSTQVAEGAAITFPADPANIDEMVFMGWTNAAIDGTQSTAPTYVTSATMGTSDVTFYAVFASVTPGTATTVTDELTRETTGVTDGSNYLDWSGKKSNSDAVYAGNSAGGNNSIQLRTNNSNSGVVTTASGGKAKKVTISWNSNTTSGRVLDIYGKNSAYSAATDLYNNSNQGAKLGSVTYGTSTELSITGDYQFIGMRSNSSAMYITSISIEWESISPDTYSDYCTTVIIPTVAKPTFSQASGEVVDGTVVTMSCTTEGATIYYSTDDGATWTEGNTYTITENVTLKAKAVNGSDESQVVEATYTVQYILTVNMEHVEYFIFNYHDEDWYDFPVDAEGRPLVHAGENVRVSVAAVDDCYTLQGLSVTFGENTIVPEYLSETEEYSFIMPASSATLTAATTAKPTHTLAFGTLSHVTLELLAGEESSFVESGDQLCEGIHVTVVATPDEGYVMGSVSVVYGDNQSVEVTTEGSNTYSFYMPTGDATITATVEEYVAQLGGTILFGSAEGSTKIEGKSSSGTGTVTYTDTGDDSNGNTWTITTVTSKTKSFTQNANYSQVGSSSNPVTSITFTTTLTEPVIITDFQAKFGGFSGTVGTITLKVGNNTVGTGSLNGTADVIVRNTLLVESGTTLTVTVTSIDKGVKCYYISYEYLEPLHINGHNGGAGGWYLIASPVTELTPSDDNGFLTDSYGSNIPDGASGTYDLYYFDQTGGENGKEWKNYRANNFNLVNGKGYLYASEEGTDLIFTGTAYSGNGVVNLTYSELETIDDNMRGWNLIGNPFGTTANLPSGLSYYTLNESRTELTPGSATTIGAMKAIFVQATATGQSVTFTKQTRNAGSNAILSLDLSSDSKGLIDRAIVRFDEGNALPKFMLDPNNTKVFIPVEGKEYAVVRNEAQGEMPVSFRAAENGTYTLTVNPEGVEMNYLHLIDNMTGADIDLLAATSTGSVATYTFNASTTDYSSRFRLVFAANNEDGVSTGSTAFAFYSNGTWVINNIGEATLQVVDVNGRILSSETVNGSVSKAINASAGVYMLRLINGNDVKTQKIVVR